MQIQITGPFVSEYSLARVNRLLAKNIAELNPGYTVRLYASESLEGRKPAAEDYKRYPYLKKLSGASLQSPDAEIYSAFPKSTSDDLGLNEMRGRVRYAYIAWEETAFPSHWVKEINEHLHAVFVISNHVAQVLEHANVKVPVVTINPGVELPLEVKPYKVKSKKKFKFLHISSGHVRKGVDLLLKSYLQEFSAADDVVLILKLLPNPNQNIADLLKETRINAPEVEVIQSADLLDEEIASLYQQSDCFVLPSRVEGFGLPAAEAMLHNKLLITTGFSGQTDFCSEENTILLPYKMSPATESHHGLPGSRWAEPDTEVLKREMRNVYTNKEAFSARIVRAKETASKLNWENTANLFVQLLKEGENLVKLKSKSFTVISPFNIQNGISHYSENLYAGVDSLVNIKVLATRGSIPLKQSENVSYVWDLGQGEQQDLLQAVSKVKSDLLHIQYHTDFFPLSTLYTLTSQSKQPVVVTLHIINDELLNTKSVTGLKNCKALIVHTDADKEKLESAGHKNVVVIKHGVDDFPYHAAELIKQQTGFMGRKVIATHGLVHEKKGFLELLQALPQLTRHYPDLLLICATAVSNSNSTSQGVFKQMQELVAKHGLEKNVIFLEQFLANEEVILLLQSADLLVLPYAELQEGASGAIRTCAASGRPIIHTDSSIFKDFPAGRKITGNNPAVLAKAIEEVLENPSLKAELAENSRLFAKEYSWRKQKFMYLTRMAQIIVL